MRLEIERMLEIGMIRPSQSEWASPVHMVRKDDGTWRFCEDLREVNAVTKRDAYPLPRMDDLISCMASAKHFSSIDLTSGYWQIPVHPDDICKTAFICPFGLFEFVVTPFGAKNSGAMFQRVMDTILAGLQWSRAPTYVDNIGVWSGSDEDHVKMVEEVLDRMLKAGAKLNPKKCEFGCTSIHYLGFIVDQNGLHLSDCRTKVISEYPQPTG
jgi:hypothetical protein